MLRKTALLSALLLSACELGSSPAPNILSIEPQEVVRGEAVTLAIKLDAPLPVKIDYGNKTATLLAPPTLRIGGQEVVIDGRDEENGTLLATVPADLSMGHQDVRLVMEDGTEALGTEGLTVLPPPPFLAAETMEEQPGLVTGILIDTIPDQVRDVPFVVTLRAEGPEAARFGGQVMITTNKGRVSPNVSSSFVDGSRQERIVLDRPGNNVILTVRAGDTLIAQSNPFKVSPRE
ncbi:MAG TPA: hypothetical protein VF794_17840 [Archangium sp.]|jgi:hypothetical protein|uniref:hypothetical protein n=1 Tax=Archangium sp. TaxID=1872627 RepID=UPI002ED90AAA